MYGLYDIRSLAVVEWVVVVVVMGARAGAPAVGRFARGRNYLCHLGVGACMWLLSCRGTAMGAGSQKGIQGMLY